MEALELIQLGRRLVKLGEAGLRGNHGRGEFGVGASLVLRDVLAHAETSVTEIAGRTELPQSYVSESVAQLRHQGLLVTEADPVDRRRTLVSASRKHLKTVAEKGRTPVDDLVRDALGDVTPKQASKVLSSLEGLAKRLQLGKPGPLVRALRGDG
jgi:DNA-binding MarR family transcriptional regulator